MAKQKRYSERLTLSLSQTQSRAVEVHAERLKCKPSEALRHLVQLGLYIAVLDKSTRLRLTMYASSEECDVSDVLASLITKLPDRTHWGKGGLA